VKANQLQSIERLEKNPSTVFATNLFNKMSYGDNALAYAVRFWLSGDAIYAIDVGY